jgi:hypothetical protein
MRNAKSLKNDNTRAMLDKLMCKVLLGSDFTSREVAVMLSKKNRLVTARALGRMLAERYDVVSIDQNKGTWKKIREVNVPWEKKVCAA